MIRLLQKGTYRLVWSKDNQKIIYLGNQGYLWSYAKGIGELLTFSKHAHKRSYIMAEGRYKIYEVKKEPRFIDLQHLELLVRPGVWQGYLLLTGLPVKKKIRSRIVPTDEIIRALRTHKTRN